MSKPVFIDDGYTETADLEYGVSVKFRPCVGCARAEFFDSLPADDDGNVKATPYRKASNEFLVKYVQELDGKSGPFTPEQFDTIPDDLFEQIRKAVFRMEKMANGETTEEADAKN